ncbi:MAG: hypothetical protein HON04_13900 [Planctomicrobium sp.]|nr:hypothetical protein [Planctomicrobium sp.]
MRQYASVALYVFTFLCFSTTQLVAQGYGGVGERGLVISVAMMQINIQGTLVIQVQDSLALTYQQRLR